MNSRQPFVSLTPLFRNLACFCAAIGLLHGTQLQAANVVWTGSSGLDTNWSDAANWSGAAVPTSVDDVKFFDGGGTNLLNVNNVVDANLTIGSLFYGNTNNSHTTFIADGLTLTITNTAGLIAATLGDVGVAKLVTNNITGAHGTLNLTNPAAVISINQGGAAGSSREVLNLTGLSTFTALANRIGVGTTTSFNPGNANNKCAGILFLAQTNFITLSLTDTLANYQTSGTRTNSIEISKNPANNGGIASFLYLGQDNTIFLDSIGTGRDKNNGTAAWGWMGFNPAYTNNNPVARFRGVNGGTNRVTWWAVGDGAGSGSSSNGGVGTNDFSNGTIDALIEVLSVGRDATAVDTWGGPHRGNLILSSGTIDANTVIIGNQSLETGASTTPCLGIVNVGPQAVLRANIGMTLGFTTLATAAGINTTGNLLVNGGSVFANSIAVGANSSNSVALANGTLVITNTLATNALGLGRLAITNSLIGLTVPANGSLRGLTRNFVTGGATNLIQLNSTPVFLSSYPQQFPLIRYSTWTGVNNLGLTNIPPWAPGATLVSNGPNSSLDLLMPADPRPIITAQPTPYSGAPGDNVTSSFAVGIAATSVTPLGYQWFYANNGATNQLFDGPGPSGSSTLSGALTSNLQILNAQTNDSGNYFAVVTNVYGTNITVQALLTISTNPIPPIITGPAVVTTTNGITTLIANSVSGSPVPSLFWQFNGTNLFDGIGQSGSSTISGSSSSTLTIGNPQFPNDQGTYSLVASNVAGMTTNATVLSILVPAAITVQPVSVVVTNTQSASLSVTASGTSPLKYQWYKNGPANPISSLVNPSATNATFTIASAGPSDTATYMVIVQNAAGSVTSSNATITVNSTMSAIALSPANNAAGICYDTPLSITFSQAPVLRNVGKIRVYSVTNSVTPVETIDLSLNGPNGAQGRINFPGDTTPFNYFPVVITGTTAAIYPPSASGLLNSNQTYYVIIDDGVFADSAGAYFAGITATNTWQFATKTGGPVDPVNPVVNLDGSADFVTVQGAVDSLAANANGLRRTITVKNGVYFELINISGKTNLTLRGQSRMGTILKYPNNASVAPGGSTSSRMSFKINANDVAIDNLSITNSTPQGGSQAEAFTTSGNHTIVNNSEIASRQDTLLPGQVFFYNSRIIGNFDYIWGGGNLYFTKCNIHTIAGGGNLTAARTATSGSQSASTPWVNPNGTTYSASGFSFVDCLFSGDPGVTGVTLAGNNGTGGGLSSWALSRFDTNVYIGPTVALSNSYVFWQFQNVYTNGITSVSFTNVQTLGVTNSDPRLLAVTNIVTWLNGWSPALAPNITTNPLPQSVSQGQTATFSVAATGIPDPGYQWLSNGVPISGATGATLSVSNVMRAAAAGYAVVVSNGSGSVTSSVAALTYTGNVAPVAQVSSYTRIAGAALDITIAGNLATNWSDADGDLVSLTGSISSTNGATVTYDGSFVHYNNVNGVNDQINYTVGDGQGGTASGVINVAIISNASQSFQSVTTDVNQHPALSGVGLPNYTYGVESALDIAGPWTNAGTVQTDSNGNWSFTDIATTVTAGNVFYRLYWPYDANNPPQ